MAQAIVHFEITGRDPAKLRSFYGALFGWTFDLTHVTAPEVSDAGQYGFITPPEGAGPVYGGVGGGRGFAPRFVMYVGVDDVGVVLRQAERLGGTPRLGPITSPTGLVTAQFADPEGNVVGIAGPR